MKAALLACSAGLALVLPMAARAQVSVTVGYTSLTSASGSRLREEVLNLRERSSFGISGGNVEPIDGGTTYTPSTIWRIRDPDAPSSLLLRLEDPLFEGQQSSIDTRQVRSGRIESVGVVIGAPLNAVYGAGVVSPRATVFQALPSPLSTTVFP